MMENTTETTSDRATHDLLGEEEMVCKVRASEKRLFKIKAVLCSLFVFVLALFVTVFLVLVNQANPGKFEASLNGYIESLASDSSLGERLFLPLMNDIRSGVQKNLALELVEKWPGIVSDARKNYRSFAASTNPDTNPRLIDGIGQVISIWEPTDAILSNLPALQSETNQAWLKIAVSKAVIRASIRLLGERIKMGETATQEIPDLLKSLKEIRNEDEPSSLNKQSFYEIGNYFVEYYVGTASGQGQP